MSTNPSEIAKPLKLQNLGNLDWWYGPYNSDAEAKSAVPVNIRWGKRVGIVTNGTIVEKWWPNVNSDLTPYSAQFEIDKQNIYSYNYEYPGFTLNGTGDWVPSAGSKSIVNVPVIASKQKITISGYIADSLKKYYFKNSSGVITGGVGSLSTLPLTISIPSDAISFSACVSRLDQPMPDIYIGYGDTVELTEYVKSINNKAVIAAQLSTANKVPDPITADNAVNKKYFDANAAKTSEFIIETTVKTPKNRINPLLIESDKFVSSSGAISTNNAVGWKMIRITVTPGEKITFGNLGGTGGYAVFKNSATVNNATGNVGEVTSYSGSKVITLNVPDGAVVLALDLKRPTDADLVFAQATLNAGDALLTPYEPYFAPITSYKVLSFKGATFGGNVEKFTDIKDVPQNYTGNAGKLLAVKADGSGLEFTDKPAPGGQTFNQSLNTIDNVKFNSIEVAAFKFDLPTGSGAPPAGVMIGDAWIDNASGTIKVRLT